jgi:Leucine-rich repeat (LRR) protein
MSEEEKTNQQEEEKQADDPRVARVVGLPLDWTQLGDKDKAPKIRYPSDVTEIDPSEEELIVVGTAGQKITNMGPDLYKELNPELKQLVLRSHVIRKMEGIQGLASLELLELYDNQVDALQCLDEGNDGAPGPTLRVLDMSYNVIRDMQPVQLCPNLQELCK